MAWWDNSPTWTNGDHRLTAALSAFFAASGGRVSLGNLWRSNAEQAALYAKKPNLAAPPGKSNHEFGLAADLEYSDDAARRWAHENAARFGLHFPMDYEPWHIELIGINRHNMGNPNQQIGGGREAYPMMAGFLNPYDAMAQQMSQYDPYDPMQQFETLISMITGPGGGENMLSTPGMSEMSTPTMDSPAGALEDMASQISDADIMSPDAVAGTIADAAASGAHEGHNH